MENKRVHKLIKSFGEKVTECNRSSIVLVGDNDGTYLGLNGKAQDLIIMIANTMLENSEFREMVLEAADFVCDIIEQKNGTTDVCAN